MPERFSCILDTKPEVAMKFLRYLFLDRLPRDHINNKATGMIETDHKASLASRKNIIVRDPTRDERSSMIVVNPILRNILTTFASFTGLANILPISPSLKYLSDTL